MGISTINCRYSINLVKWKTNRQKKKEQSLTTTPWQIPSALSFCLERPLCLILIYPDSPHFPKPKANVTASLKSSVILPAKRKLPIIQMTTALLSTAFLKHYPFSNLLCIEVRFHLKPTPMLKAAGFIHLWFPCHPSVRPPEGSLAWWLILKHGLGSQTW